MFLGRKREREIESKSKKERETKRKKIKGGNKKKMAINLILNKKQRNWIQRENDHFNFPFLEKERETDRKGQRKLLALVLLC